MKRNQKRRLLAGALAVGLLVSACGTSATSAPSAGTESVKLVNPGTLTVITISDRPTLDLVAGKPVGVYAPMVTRLAKNLGLTLKLDIYEFSSMIPALQSHRGDIIGGFSMNQSRAQVMYQTMWPTWFQGESTTVKAGASISSWQEAADRKLTLATVTGMYWIGPYEKLGINIHAFDTIDACFLDVLNGGAFGCTVGAFGTAFRRAQDPNNPVSKLISVPIVGPGVLVDPNTFAVAKDNPVMARAVQQTVADLWRDGTIRQAFLDVFNGSNDADYFLVPPEGAGIYIPGPWEEGVVPPAAETYPKVSPLVSGALTVGVLADSPMLSVKDDGTLSGPESRILEFAAGKLGLKLGGVKITDEADALNSGKVDVVAGQFAETKERSKKLWMTLPVAFSPDYIFVAPAKDGSLPAYTSWEDVSKAGGKLAVVKGDPREAQIAKAGVGVLEVDNAGAGLKALTDGTAAGWVGSSVDYAQAVSADPSLAKVGIGYLRNSDVYTQGDAYGWGVKWGNATLTDALNQAITAAYQQDVIANAYTSAWPGANTTALTGPGPAYIGSSRSKDYVWDGIFMTGPWNQNDWWKTAP